MIFAALYSQASNKACSCLLNEQQIVCTLNCAINSSKLHLNNWVICSTVRHAQAGKIIDVSQMQGTLWYSKILGTLINLNKQLRLSSNKVTYNCSTTVTTAFEASLTKETVVAYFFVTRQWCSGSNILRFQTKDNPDKQLVLFWRSKRTSPNESVTIWLMLSNEGNKFADYSCASAWWSR